MKTFFTAHTFLLFSLAKADKCKDQCFGPSMFTLETIAEAKETDKILVHAHANLFSGMQSNLSKIQRDWNSYTEAVANATMMSESKVGVIDAPRKDWDEKKQCQSQELLEKFDSENLFKTRSRRYKQQIDPNYFLTDAIVPRTSTDILLHKPDDDKNNLSYSVISSSFSDTEDKKIQWTLKQREKNVLHPDSSSDDSTDDFRGSYRASSTSIDRVKTEMNNKQCPTFASNKAELKAEFSVDIFAMESRIGSISPLYVGNELEVVGVKKDSTPTDQFCLDITAIRDSKDYKNKKKIVDNLLPNTYVSQFNSDGSVWDRFLIIRHGRVQSEMKFFNLVRNTMKGSGYKGKGIAFSWMLHGNHAGLLHEENKMVIAQKDIWNAAAGIRASAFGSTGLEFLPPLNVYANGNGLRGFVNAHVKSVFDNLQNATGFNAEIPVFQEHVSPDERIWDSLSRKMTDAWTTVAGTYPEQFAYFLLELVSSIVTNAYFHLKTTNEVFLLFFNCKSGLDRTGYIYALFIAFKSIMQDFSHNDDSLEDQREQLNLFRKNFLHDWKKGHGSEDEKKFRNVFLQTMISISGPITYISTGIRGIKSPSFEKIIKAFLPMDGLNTWPEPHDINAIQKFINDAGTKRGA